MPPKNLPSRANTDVEKKKNRLVGGQDEDDSGSRARELEILRQLTL